MRSSFLIIAIILMTIHVHSQQAENWTKDQLMQPADLAGILQAGKAAPLIYCVGPGVYIPNSVNIGMTKEKDNLAKLKSELKSVRRDKSIVIYCGCCPFDHCPNIRPAIQALKDLKFTNYRLLNLEHNIKIDWIDKGYPVSR